VALAIRICISLGDILVYFARVMDPDLAAICIQITRMGEQV
jgi:hypothetical protein